MVTAILERRYQTRSIAHRDGKLLRRHQPSVRLPQNLFHDVQQLPHVARPAVSLECAERIFGELQLAAGATEKVSHERLDVLRPLPKRRDVQVDDAQPIQKVLAELAGGNQLVEIAVRCRHYANVEARLRVIRAHRLDFPVLEKSQQEGLHAEAHFTDFIEEQRATMCELELAALVAVGAGEASLDVPEQL